MISEPSIKPTKNIVESCNLIGVKVLDHIIVGREREDYLSFAKCGLLGG